MDETETIKESVKNNTLSFRNGRWYICETIISPAKNYVDSTSQWHSIFQESTDSEEIASSVPDDVVKEEWFQIAAIKKRPSNIEFFERLASVEVLEFAIKERGEYVICSLSSTAKRDLVQDANYADVRKRQKILDAILSCPVDEIYRNYILEIAHRRIESSQDNIDRAIDVVLENVKYDCFAECALDWAQNGDVRAQKAVFAHPEVEICRNYILEIARKRIKGSQDDINRAISIVLNHVRYGCFAECALDWAKNGDVRAQKALLVHPEVEICRNYILEIACRRIESSQDNVNQAIDIVLKNALRYECFKESVLDWAKRGDVRAQEVLLAHPEIAICGKYILAIARRMIESSQDNINRAIDIVLKNALRYECFKESTLDWAKRGDVRAQEIVLAHPEIEVYRKLIIEIAHRRIESSQDNINRAVNIVIENALRNECFKESALELARNGNGLAQGIVLAHPEIEIYRKLIIEIARRRIESSQDNINQAIDIVLENALRYRCFKECTLELARNGNELAQGIILANPRGNIYEDYLYEGYVVDVALEKVECPEKLVEQAQDVVSRDVECRAFIACTEQLIERGNERVIRNALKHPQTLRYLTIISLVDNYPEAQNYLLQNITLFQNYIKKIIRETQSAHEKKNIFIEQAEQTVSRIYEMKKDLWVDLLKKNGLSDNMTREVEFCYREEYGQLSIEELENAAKFVVGQKAAASIFYTPEQWEDALLRKNVPINRLNHPFFKFEVWQRNRNMKFLKADAIKRYEDAVKRRIIP